MPISGGCPKPFFVQPWSHDLWSRPISISRLTRHFFPSTTRWGNSSDSPDPPEIACAMSAAVGNRSFGGRDEGHVVRPEGTVSDRGGHGASDLRRVGGVARVSPPRGAGKEVPRQAGDGDRPGPQVVRPRLHEERLRTPAGDWHPRYGTVFVEASRPDSEGWERPLLD